MIAVLAKDIHDRTRYRWDWDRLLSPDDVITTSVITIVEQGGADASHLMSDTGISLGGRHTWVLLVEDVGVVGQTYIVSNYVETDGGDQYERTGMLRIVDR